MRWLRVPHHPPLDVFVILVGAYRAPGNGNAFPAPSAPLAKDGTALCALCGAALSQPTVRIPGDTQVHLRCAEREAAQAWRWRRLTALAHGLTMISVVGGLALCGSDAPLLFPVFVAWLALHSLLHRRYWHYVVRDLRRWLRRG